MFQWFFDLLGGLFLLIGALILPFVLMSAYWYIYFRFVMHQKPKTSVRRAEAKTRSFFRRLFLDFPKQFVLDRLSFDPDEFAMYGFHLFVGEQGSGKTVSTVEFLRRIKQRYPLCSIATNFEYVDQDSAITSWKDLIFNNNGTYGQVDVVDEVQNWFSSNQSKDFPPEMIQEITQQRKQRKILIGTTQRFERMAKPLREQVNYIYYPLTIAGCLTIVKICKPSIDSDGQISKLRPVRRYFFVHSNEIRNSFDTYKKIEQQAKDGFHSDNRHTESSLTITNVIETAGKGRRKK